MSTIREINDPAELESLRPVWNELLARTPWPNFCQSLDWLLVFLKHYGKGKRLRVLVVEEHARPLGILPLVVWAAHPFEPFQARAGS